MDEAKTKFAPGLIGYDQVIWSNTLNLDVTNSAGTYTFEDKVYGQVGSFLNLSGNPDDSAVGQGPITFGIYSFDGGTTWNSIVQVSRAISGLSVQVEALQEGSGDTNIYVRVNSTVGGGATFPLIVKYGMIKGPNTMVILTYSDNEELKPKTQQSAILDSRTPVPKVHDSGYVPADGVLHTITHNLGYVPDVRIFYYYNQGTFYPYNNVAGSIDYFRLSTTDIKITPINLSNAYYYYIIYKEYGN
jgi:hypothetical protein